MRQARGAADRKPPSDPFAYAAVIRFDRSTFRILADALTLEKNRSPLPSL